jgi:hypothetical protein
MVTTVNYAATSTLKTTIPSEIVRSKGIEVGDRLHWEEAGGWVRFKAVKIKEETR